MSGRSLYEAVRQRLFGGKPAPVAVPQPAPPVAPPVIELPPVVEPPPVVLEPPPPASPAPKRLNRKAFYDTIRAKLFGGNLLPGQVNGIEMVLDEWEKRGLTDLRWLAYMLATDKHETNATMQAVREAYWMSEEWRKTHLRYWPFYGRGLVQLTWEANYAKMAKVVGVDLVAEPDLALEIDHAVQIMFEGMLRADTGVGDFTGRCLEQYFNDTTDDPVGARAIINGTDKAQMIAGYYYDFLAALRAAA